MRKWQKLALAFLGIVVAWGSYEVFGDAIGSRIFLHRADVRWEIGASPFCRRHGQLMRTRTVPVKYGLIVEPSALGSARKTSFPNANTSWRGGCLSGEASYAVVWSCASCEASERAWKATSGAGAAGPSPLKSP